MNTWKEITTDHLTGHVIAKDLYKAQAFYAGLFYLLVLVPAVVLLTDSHLVLPLEPGMALVTLAFGLQTLKEVSSFFNRKTADDNGNALAQKGTEEAPATPELMPQPATPTAPAGQPAE